MDRKATKHPFLRPRPILVLALVFLSACGGGSETSATPPPPPTQPGAFEFAVVDYQVDEFVGTVNIAIRRSGGSDGSISANVIVSGGDATDTDDYRVASATVNFADTETGEKTVAVEIIDDTDDETNETLILALANPAGGATIGTQDSATVTIVDDDPALSMLGGETSGLAGSGLILTLNDINDIPVDVDGTFVLSSAYLEGTLYSVTVAQQPWQPAQSCTISNGDGAMGTADITDVRVVCVELALQSLLVHREPNGQNQFDLMLISEDGQSEIGLATSIDDEVFWDIVNDRIVYHRTVNTGNADIYSVLLDGTAAAPLANTPENEQYGGASAAGIVAFSRSGNLFSIAVDGTGLTQLTDAPEDDRIRLVTADGNVVFEREIGQQRDIYAIDITGNNLVVLSDDPQDEQINATTPTGRVIYTRFNAGQTDIFSVRLDGLEPAEISADPVENESFRTLLQNDLVVWDRTASPGNRDLYVSRSDGTNQAVLANSFGDELYFLSTDDNRIVYGSRFGGQSDIYIVGADGFGRTALAASQDFEHPVGITPDGLLVYTRRTTVGLHDIYAVNLDGTGGRLVGPSSINDVHIMIASREGVDYVVYPINDGQPDLVSVKTDGSDLRRMTDSADFEMGSAITSSGGVIAKIDAGRYARIGVVDDGDVTITPPQHTDQLVRLVDPQ